MVLNCADFGTAIGFQHIFHYCYQRVWKYSTSTLFAVTTAVSVSVPLSRCVNFVENFPFKTVQHLRAKISRLHEITEYSPLMLKTRPEPPQKSTTVGEFSSPRFTFRYYIPTILEWYNKTYFAYLLLLTLATIKKKRNSYMFSDNYGI